MDRKDFCEKASEAAIVFAVIAVHVFLQIVAEKRIGHETGLGFGSHAWVWILSVGIALGGFFIFDNVNTLSSSLGIRPKARLIVQLVLFAAVALGLHAVFLRLPSADLISTSREYYLDTTYGPHIKSVHTSETGGSHAFWILLVNGLQLFYWPLSFVLWIIAKGVDTLKD